MTDRPRAVGSRRACCSSAAQSGSSRSAASAPLTSLQARRSSSRAPPELAPALREAHAVVIARRADVVDRRADAVAFAAGADRRDVRLLDLQHRAELLAERARQRIVAERVERGIDAAACGEGHLGERHEQAAVGTVVVGEQLARRVELLHRREETGEQRRIVEVGRRGAELAVDLRQAGTAETVLAAAEVDQQQARRTGVAAQLRRERAADVEHRRESRDDQRDRRDHAALARAVAPHGLHRQRILADRDGDAEGAAELGADRAHRVIEHGVVAVVARGRHPVRRQQVLQCN